MTPSYIRVRFIADKSVIIVLTNCRATATFERENGETAIQIKLCFTVGMKSLRFAGDIYTSAALVAKRPRENTILITETRNVIASRRVCDVFRSSQFLLNSHK